MDINLAAVANNIGAGAQAEIGVNFYLPKYSLGESFNALVIFAAGDTVHLKTAAGALIRARLEGGGVLVEGSEITLTIIEKGDSLLKLEVSGQNLEDRIVGRDIPAGRDAPVGSVAPRAVALIEPQAINQDLLSRPADSLGQMLQQLTALLNLPETDTAHVQQPEVGGHRTEFAGAITDLLQETGPVQAGDPANTLAPLFELFMPQAEAAQTQRPAAEGQGQEQGVRAVVPVEAQTEGERTEGKAQPQTVLSALPPATRQELLQFTQSLVAELYPPEADEPALKEITAFVERLFVKIDKPVKEGGLALRRAARELELRLNLLSETLERSSWPHKELLLQQTDRLLQQAAILREEHPLCLQLPIQFADQRQTAELYVYRRKKDNHQLDARHATILLALNTEHLGRLQAFIQVQQKNIHLKLEISNLEAVAFVKEQRDSLATLLAGAGYRLDAAVVQHLTKETGRETAQRDLEAFQGLFGHQVDIRV